MRNLGRTFDTKDHPHGETLLGWRGRIFHDLLPRPVTDQVVDGVFGPLNDSRARALTVMGAALLYPGPDAWRGPR